MVQPNPPEQPQVPSPLRVQVPQSQPQRRAPEPGKEDGPFVKYVGPASKRVIHPHQWAQRLKGDAGKSEGSHVWDVKNEKMIPSSKFTDEQLDYLLVDDMQATGGHSFLEVDYDKDGNLVQVKHDQ